MKFSNNTLCSLIVGMAVGCIPVYQSRSDGRLQEQPHSAMDAHVQELLSKSQQQKSSNSFPVLVPHQNYLILIGKYEEVKELSKLAGFSGHYGHIETMRDGKVYGCRPPQCGEMSVAELQQKFKGYPYEIREVEINGNTSKAVTWFRGNMQGTTYNLFYNNCTDAVVRMYDASGDKTVRVPPVVVDQAYATNVRLRNFMQENGITKPNREFIWFPDQFENIGKFVGKGVF